MKASGQLSLAAPAIPAETETTDISFGEIPCCPAKEKSTEKDSPVAVIRTSAVTIEITNRISDVLLRRILQEAAHTWRCRRIWRLQMNFLTASGKLDNNFYLSRFEYKNFVQWVKKSIRYIRYLIKVYNHILDITLLEWYNLLRWFNWFFGVKEVVIWQKKKRRSRKETRLSSTYIRCLSEWFKKNSTCNSFFGKRKSDFFGSSNR